MKKNMLNAAVLAVSMAGLSQAAFALPKTDPVDLEFWMSGATAQDKAVGNLMEDICLPGTLDVYRNTGTSATLVPGSAHSVYFCKVDNSAGSVPGLKKNNQLVAPGAQLNLMLHKRSIGGSAQGVNPLISGTAIAHMKLNGTTACTALPPAPGFPPRHDCTVVTENKVSEIGVSDVEPGLFYGANKPNNSKAVSRAQASAALDIVPAAALVFGVPVTDKLYIALQWVEGLITGSPFSGPKNCNPGDYTEACMPSLTKEAVATLVSGQIKKWDEFKIGGQVFTTAIQTATNATVAATLPSDLKFHMCKRINGSGTNAQQIAKFLDTPCSDSGLSPDWTTKLTGPVKHQVSGSGDMENCLADFNNGTNIGREFTSFDGTNDVFTTVTNPSSATAWAIGQQSTENNNTHARPYRFIKIDGAAPTLANAFKGRYFDVVEQTYQIRKNANPDARPLFNIISVEGANPTAIATVLNVDAIHPFGQAGYLAIGKNFPFTDTINLNGPIWPYSHAVVGGLDNCQVPVIPSSTNANKPLMGF